MKYIGNLVMNLMDMVLFIKLVEIIKYNLQIVLILLSIKELVLIRQNMQDLLIMDIVILVYQIVLVNLILLV